MEIVNGAAEGMLEERLAGLDDGELVAQEIAQKGALHALEYVQRHDCSPAVVAAMLESLRGAAALISAECLRRGLPTVVDPAAH